MFACFGRTRPTGVAHAALYAILFVLAPKVWAQSAPSAIPSPAPTNKLGQFDAAALLEVLEHVKVVGVTPWTGMQGTGTITYGSDQASYRASLTIVGSRQFRLDGQTSTGLMSIRINGRIGNIQGPTGRTYPIAPETAASGIFQFELPRLADLHKTTSVLEHGLMGIDGNKLHRITIEQPFAGQQRTLATDLYFDPSTHLLINTVNSIRVDGSPSTLLRVITYGDYRQVDGVMVPFLYSQSLSGQKQWTLQLSEVQLNPSVQSTYFEF